VVAIGLALAAVAVAASLAGVPRFIVTLGALALDSLSPASMSWDHKSAYVKCDGAIADPALWPREPRTACAAMHMCANEAVLSEAQTKALARAALALKGCGAL
jgi:hypothetical protein